MTSKIQILIYIIFFAIICASVCAYYNGKVLGGLIRKLHLNGKTTKENATSLKDLGYSRLAVFFLSVSLGENLSLSKYVKSEFSKEEMEIHKEKGLCQRYYIPEESVDVAMKRYDGGKMTLPKLIIGIVACIIAAVISINVFPYAISMLSGAGESFDTDRTITGDRIKSTVESFDAEEIGNRK